MDRSLFNSIDVLVAHAIRTAPVDLWEPINYLMTNVLVPGFRFQAAQAAAVRAAQVAEAPKTNSEALVDSNTNAANQLDSDLEEDETDSEEEESEVDSEAFASV